MLKRINRVILKICLAVFLEMVVLAFLTLNFFIFQVLKILKIFFKIIVKCTLNHFMSIIFFYSLEHDFKLFLKIIKLIDSYLIWILFV